METQTVARRMTQGYSLRLDQVAFVEEMADRQLHGNRSRVVQEALDLYRRVQTGRVMVVPFDTRMEEPTDAGLDF